jgi:signal transduction histidine kinase
VIPASRLDHPDDALLKELGGSAAVQSILEVVCRATGMGFAAVAHVTEDRWVACEVRDEIGFGLPAGGELPVKSTLCDTVRGTRDCIVIDEVAADPVFRDHHTPKIYGLQSYIAYPILLTDGEIFGTLCAIDPKPAKLDTPQTRGMFSLFAQLIATHVEKIRTTAETVTLERRVSDALAEKKVYADIVESSTAAVTALGLDWRILAINRANAEAFEAVYGKRPKVGEDFRSLFEGAPAHLAQQTSIWSRALAGETFVMIGEFGDAAFERRHYEVRFTPLLSPGGARIGASSTSYDVTARVQAETQLAATQVQLRQAQKMEAMGQLTGGVAHDFNNLLTPIVGSLDMLQRRGLGGEREARLIAAAAQSAERARTLVQRLLAFARRQPLQPAAVDIAALVSGMADLIASTTGARIRLDINIADGLPSAHADANQLEMALLNLGVNARDAMPDGGNLKISAEAITVGAEHGAGLPPGDYVRLSVGDTGSGMDEATMARAIEPFFSTKGVGQGTGLGLSMVDGLARQLGGALTLDSQVGAGTAAHLWLPVSNDALAVDATRPSETANADAALGVALLVDDEELVRLSTADMLADLGYRVVEATSAEEALRRLREGLTPDLIITDHIMPGMTGTDLARILATERPTTPVLIVSGYAEVDGVAPGFARLTKPFRHAELRASLAGLRR